MAITVRTVSVDVARGALILYIVVIIHGFFWLKLLPQHISSALLFEMPCIFIASGHGYFWYENALGHHRLLRTYNTYLSFLITRFSRILIPYFAYAIFCLTICLLLRDSQGKTGWDIYHLVASWLNPASAGAEHSIGMLNWHLWFITPFLSVTALLPFSTKIRFTAKIPLWIFMIGISMLLYFVSLARFEGSFLLKNTVFYSIWAMFGYHLAKPAVKLGNRDYWPVFLIALSLLIASRLFSPEPFPLNMQKNKFPPNYAFFLFSCAWVSLLLILTPLLSKRLIDKLSTAVWFRPFMENGYSIYLWQGVGYSSAVYLGKKLGLPIIAVWGIALILTTIIGIITSPIERLRINRVSK